MISRLAIIASHPIQYYAPWFKLLAQEPNLSVKVFYLWDFGINEKQDPGFNQSFRWDIPLLEGYEYEFVTNRSCCPGTSHFWGLVNPTAHKQINQFSPNVILFMGYCYWEFMNLLIRYGNKRVPIIFRGDSHRLMCSNGVRSLIRREGISKILNSFSACLYVGKANYDYFRHNQVLPEKLFFSPHAIDHERFMACSSKTLSSALEWKKELGIPDHHRVVLFAGKFEEKKCPMDLMQAYWQAKIPNVSLLFVGSGNLENQLRVEARKYSGIYFAPFQNQSQMPRTYAIADVFVLPSYGNAETWGLAINEAMCLSKPIIVSNHVGCAQDLAQPYINGLVFRAGDVDDLANNLKEAFSDEARLKYWGDQSFKIISQYNYQKATEGLRKAIQFVLN